MSSITDLYDRISHMQCMPCSALADALISRDSLVQVHVCTCIDTDCTLVCCDKHLCLFYFLYRFTLHHHRWIKIDVTTLHFVSCDPHFVPVEVEACQAVWPVQRGEARYCRALRGNGRWCLQEGTGCREWVGIDQLPLWCHGGKVGIKWSIYMETSCWCVFLLCHENVHIFAYSWKLKLQTICGASFFTISQNKSPQRR